MWAVPLKTLLESLQFEVFLRCANKNGTNYHCIFRLPDAQIFFLSMRTECYELVNQTGSQYNTHDRVS